MTVTLCRLILHLWFRSATVTLPDGLILRAFPMPTCRTQFRNPDWPRSGPGDSESRCAACTCSRRLGRSSDTVPSVSFVPSYCHGSSGPDAAVPWGAGGSGKTRPASALVRSCAIAPWSGSLVLCWTCANEQGWRHRWGSGNICTSSRRLLWLRSATRQLNSEPAHPSVEILPHLRQRHILIFAKKGYIEKKRNQLRQKF